MVESGEVSAGKAGQPLPTFWHSLSLKALICWCNDKMSMCVTGIIGGGISMEDPGTCLFMDTDRAPSHASVSSAPQFLALCQLPRSLFKVLLPAKRFCLILGPVTWLADLGFGVFGHCEHFRGSLAPCWGSQNQHTRSTLWPGPVSTNIGNGDSTLHSTDVAPNDNWKFYNVLSQWCLSLFPHEKNSNIFCFVVFCHFCLLLLVHRLLWTALILRH